MSIRLIASSIVLACLAVPALAAAGEPPTGSFVTAVQSPAWLVHGDSTTPLKPGMSVADGDTLRTAAGGRVYLALPEHSTVKLGENTEFATPKMDMTQDAQGSLFKGALHILKGVFRFTTSVEAKLERRDVEIVVATATIGIRGTDVWGRAGTDGGLVALLEGKISMDMPGHAGMKMEEPMQENLAVTKDKVADWAAQTDVVAGAGVLTGDGHWDIALLSSPSADDAARLMKKLAAAGYPAEDGTIQHKGREWHRLAIRQAATYKDAGALAARLHTQFPALKPWIYEQK